MAAQVQVLLSQLQIRIRYYPSLEGSPRDGHQENNDVEQNEKTNTKSVCHSTQSILQIVIKTEL